MTMNNSLLSKYGKYFNLILPLLFTVILIICSRDYLLQIEGRSIFLFDWFWIKDFLNKPAAPLNCLGMFFTQFMHLPWLGALLWTALLSVSAIATSRVYGIALQRDVIAMIPSFILAGANMSLGYLIYIMNSPGYFFSPVLGYLFTILAVVLFRKIKSPILRPLFIIAWGIAGYWFAGYYAFAGLAAAFTDLVMSRPKRSDTITAAAATASVILLAPLALYGLTTYNLSQSWSLGLPTSLYEETHFRTFGPVITATLVPVLLPFLKRITGSTTRSALFRIPVLTISVILLYLSWSKDINFRAEISMLEAANELEWEKPVEILQELSSRADKKPDYQPTRVMVLLKDLALVKTDREGQAAFSFDDGSMKQKNSYDIPMVLQIGKVLYLHYGIPGFCHRWCLEETGEFGWSYSGLKYLTMASISMNDRKVVLKYLDMLDHTLFYRKWSASQRMLCQGNADFSKVSPYDHILPLVCHEDRLSEDVRGSEFMLDHHFLGARPANATPMYDRVALFWALKSQNSTAFWTKFLLYIESAGFFQLDRYYQEAAYLYSHLGNDKALMSLPYDNNTKQLYDSFMTAARKYSSGINTLQDARRLFPEQLRNTYFYYYYFVRGLQSF
ncbi:MAG: hypothetical protein IJU24_04705 [Bacteroidaceae bacterium]|nr:hypothetical protein [Bacteroidaceae bacterium]